MSSLFASSARRGRKGEQGAPGSAVSGGRVFYLSNQGGSPPDYEGLALVPDNSPEDAMTATGITALDGEVLMQGPSAPSVWITEAEVPGISVIDAGVWTIKLFAAATAGDGNSKIRFKLYKATTDLVSETLLFTWSDSAALPTVSSSAIDVEDVSGTLDLDVTDRLILRAYAITKSTTPVDVSLYHSGTSRYTRVNSPIVVATVYSDLTPLSGGTAHPGVQNVASRGDHRHAHGIIAGGNTHALAIANGAAGYISGTDKAKLDSITIADLPSADEKAALVGTSGTSPSTTNKFVDDADSRLTNSRTPTTHASSHVTGGIDVIQNAVSNGNSGLMSGTDKAKLDTVTVANIPSTSEKAALAGTSGTAPSGSNKLVDNADSRLSDARTPSTHASSHVTGGSDVIANAVSGGNAGLMSGTDKAKVDSITVANIPSANEKAAIVGTSGTAVSGSNKLVDNADTRLSDARTPTTHATSHVTGGSDVIADAVANGNAGLLSGADKAKLDGMTAGAAVASVGATAPIASSGGTTPTISIAAASGASAGSMSSSDFSKLASITVANIPTASEKAALAGTSGTAVSGTNKLVDNADTRLTNARTPSAHATSHVTGGSDVIANAIASGASGLMSGADKAKLDGVEALADVTTFAKVNTVLATANASISVNSQKVVNVATPTTSTDAATKGYVDGLVGKDMVFGVGSLTTNTTLRFLTPGYLAGNALATNQDFLVAIDRRITRLSFYANVAGAATGANTGNTVTANLLKNGSIVASITHDPATQSGTTTFAAITYTAGVDTIGVSVSKSGAINTSPTNYYVTIGG